MLYNALQYSVFIIICNSSSFCNFSLSGFSEKLSPSMGHRGQHPRHFSSFRGLSCLMTMTMTMMVMVMMSMMMMMMMMGTCENIWPGPNWVLVGFQQLPRGESQLACPLLGSQPNHHHHHHHHHKHHQQQQQQQQHHQQHHHCDQH